MVRFIILSSFIFLISCADFLPEKSTMGDSAIKLDSLDSTSSVDSVWICHHPGTEQHNAICRDGFYPSGCYVRGDDSKFCWQLLREDCSSKHAEDWQTIHCSHFESR